MKYTIEIDASGTATVTVTTRSSDGILEASAVIFQGPLTKWNDADALHAIKEHFEAPVPQSDLIESTMRDAG